MIMYIINVLSLLCALSSKFYAYVKPMSIACYNSVSSFSPKDHPLYDPRFKNMLGRFKVLCICLMFSCMLITPCFSDRNKGNPENHKSLCHAVEGLLCQVQICQGWKNFKNKPHERNSEDSF